MVFKSESIRPFFEAEISSWAWGQAMYFSLKRIMGCLILWFPSILLYFIVVDVNFLDAFLLGSIISDSNLLMYIILCYGL